MLQDLFGGMHPSLIWGIVAIVLAAIEIVMPGVFFLWIAIAAAVTAIVELIIPMGSAYQLLVFSVLSAISLSAGRLWYLARPSSQDPLLNDKAARLIGRPVTVSEAIVMGQGRVRIDDSSWRATGPDAPEGAQMTVVEVDGATLVVAFPAA